MEAMRSDDLGDGIQRITMARPRAMNAIDRTMRDEFAAAMTAIAEDPRVRAVVITGQGPHFSAGGDIHFLQAMTPVQVTAYHRETLELVRLIALCPKPTIASVRGACAGGALGFALCCDYLLASRTAKFSAQFLRIGLVADMGIGFLLTRRLGAHHARRFLLDNRSVDAAVAEALGLCDEVHPDEVLDDATLSLGRRLSALPPRAVRQTKWLMRQAEGNFARFLEDELRAASECLGSEEFAEGTAAFLEKRAPRFQ